MKQKDKLRLSSKTLAKLNAKEKTALYADITKLTSKRLLNTEDLNTFKSFISDVQNTLNSLKPFFLDFQNNMALFTDGRGDFNKKWIKAIAYTLGKYHSTRKIDDKALATHFDKRLGYKLEWLSKANQFFPQWETTLEDIIKKLERIEPESFQEFINDSNTLDAHEKVRKGGQKTRDTKTAEKLKKEEAWQKMANEIWQRNPNFSINDVAYAIGKKSKKKSETIRKSIKRPASK